MLIEGHATSCVLAGIGQAQNLLTAISSSPSEDKNIALVIYRGMGILVPMTLLRDILKRSNSNSKVLIIEMVHVISLLCMKLSLSSQSSKKKFRRLCV